MVGAAGGRYHVPSMILSSSWACTSWMGTREDSQPTVHGSEWSAHSSPSLLQPECLCLPRIHMWESKRPVGCR